MEETPAVRGHDRAIKHSFWLVVVLASLLSFPSLNRAFYTRGEPREALVAQSMLATGNWISPPAYNGAVPSKPPFSHWLIALASLPGGEVTESTARLPSAVAYVLFCAAFFLFVARRAGASTGVVASGILLSSVEWLRSGSTCRVDTILATSISGALLALFCWQEEGRRGVPWLALALLSAAALTKGPVGIVLPLGIFSLYRLLAEGAGLRPVARVAASALILAAPVLVVASLWYVAGYLARGDDFLAKVWYENVERFAGTMADEPHKHSVAYLLGMLILMLLPWSLAWLVALARGAGLRRVLKSPLTVWRGLSDLERFSLLSATCIVLFFCIPSSKRSVYLLPAYPFVALLAALWLSRWEERVAGLLRMLSLVACVLCTLLPAVSLGLLVWPSAFSVPWFPSALWAAVGPMKVVLVVAGLAAVWKLTEAQASERLAVRVVACAAIAGITVVDAGMFRISPQQWLASPAFVDAVKPEGRERLYSFGSEAYAASFYLKKPFFGATRDMPAGSAIFVERKNLERFRSEFGGQVRELSSYSSGLEGKRETVVVEWAP